MQAKIANPQISEQGTAKFIGKKATKRMKPNETNRRVRKLLKVENQTSLLLIHSDS